MLIETKVSQKHGARKEKSSRVGLILALDIKTDVTATWLEDGHVTTHVAARYNTRATDQGRSNVCQDT